MIEVSDVNVYNFKNAFIGMRNPLESWGDMDSKFSPFGKDLLELGEKDWKLALKLVRAGTDHSKFMRQIFVSMQITAPLYWWKEMDTYKISTVANSTSTMHTIHKTKITPDLFSTENLDNHAICVFERYLDYLEELRISFLENNDKRYWKMLIQMLPDSFNQTRMWTGNYQVLRNIRHNRNNHKLQEWQDFCDIIDTLPCSELITVK